MRPAGSGGAVGPPGRARIPHPTTMLRREGRVRSALKEFEALAENLFTKASVVCTDESDGLVQNIY